MTDDAEVAVESAADLDAPAVLRVARQAQAPVLGTGLLADLGDGNRRMLEALGGAADVYGVNTAMGAMSGRRLTDVEQARHQEQLMVARAVGTPPWLARDEVRAALAVRLRTLLNGDSGVRPHLCTQLAALLAHDVLPAVPRTAMGAAGEILALAHLGGPVSGHGQVLGGDGSALRAAPVLEAAGLAPLALSTKEGIALIEGVPVTTGLAVLRAADARRALRQAVAVTAAQFALSGASRDCLDPALMRGDDDLTTLNAQLRSLAGPATAVRALQPPVSFRVTAGVLAHLVRTLRSLDAAIERALVGVTDSPAFFAATDDAPARFVGSAGFSGYDLAAHLQQTSLALAAAAEVGATRLHRLMDPRVTGLPAQLSSDPGPQTGLSPVHKRAVGIVHELRRTAAPSTLGTVETSLGQEDVQSFSLEAAEATRAAVAGFSDVLACETLAVHQMRCLGAELPAGSRLLPALTQLADLLPGSTADRPWGLDLTVLGAALTNGLLAD